MSDAISNAAVVAADAGVIAARIAADVALKSVCPGWSAILVPIVDDGAAELESVLATAIPKAVSAIEADVEAEIAKVAAWLRAHVTKARTQPAVVDPNSPLAKLPSGILIQFYDLIHGVISPPAGQFLAGWSQESIRQNAAGVEWLLKQRGFKV